MSYDICLKAQVGNTDKKVPFGKEFNITYNITNILLQSSKAKGWNGCCELQVSYLKPKFREGLMELLMKPQKYKEYEASNGWGTIDTVVDFYQWFFAQIADFEDDELQYLWLEVS